MSKIHVQIDALVDSQEMYNLIRKNASKRELLEIQPTLTERFMETDIKKVIEELLMVFNPAEILQEIDLQTGQVHEYTANEDALEKVIHSHKEPGKTLGIYLANKSHVLQSQVIAEFSKAVARNDNARDLRGFADIMKEAYMKAKRE